MIPKLELQALDLWISPSNFGCNSTKKGGEQFYCKKVGDHRPDRHLLLNRSSSAGGALQSRMISFSVAALQS